MATIKTDGNSRKFDENNIRLGLNIALDYYTCNLYFEFLISNTGIMNSNLFKIIKFYQILSSNVIKGLCYPHIINI